MNHGLTLEEIGDKFDLTRERVRQIREKAIRRLKHTSRSKLLKHISDNRNYKFINIKLRITFYEVILFFIFTNSKFNI